MVALCSACASASRRLSATVPERREVLERFEAYRRTGDRSLRNALIEEHRWVAVHCARRFANRGEPMHDLLQVAQLGVLKAVERYDPTFNVTFSTFAVPTVTGELRRHFRDATWPVHVPRRVKELHLALGAAMESLHHDLGRPPRVEEVAERMGTSVEEVLEGMEANAAYRSGSLSTPSDRDGDDTPMVDRLLGGDDPGHELADDRVTVARLLAELPEREQRILYLRYFEDRTQSEIAKVVGLSQVHVSRVLRATLDGLADQVNVGTEPAE